MAESRLPGALSNLPKPGVVFDKAPPAVTVVRDGPAGELLNGTAPSVVPEAAVDAAVAQGLRPWLTQLERRRLAEASQRAAAEFTLQPIAWEALDPSGAKTAVGTAVAVDNPYRAVRGHICRELRQSLIKGNEPHLEQVTLCRQEYGAGLAVWIVGRADQ
jgi:surface antigen